MTTGKRSENYVNPEIKVIDIIFEGVLCASNGNGETEDGGMLPE